MEHGDVVALCPVVAAGQPYGSADDHLARLVSRPVAGQPVRPGDAVGVEEQEQVARANKLEAMPIPTKLNYRLIKALRYEAMEKLDRVRPETIGQAQRIPGMTPAAISLLLVHLERARRTRVA